MLSPRPQPPSRPRWLRIRGLARRLRALGLALPLLLLLAPLAPVHAARLALVIGNKDYSVGALRNPINDAEAVAAALQGLDFEVSLVRNLRRDDIGQTIERFANRIRPGDDVLVFYAGHGLQVKGVNYLPAVDARIGVESDVPLNSLNLTELLQRLDEAKAGVRLLLVDACRDNPYSRSFRSASRGLARVEGAPSGTLMHFATRPGGVAADGSGSNGLYTTELLKHLAEPGLPVESMLKRVASGVRESSGGGQQPWTEGALDGEFYFAGAAVARAAPPPPAAAVAPEPLPPPPAAAPAVPGVRDCPTCPTLVLVPGGSFQMGAADGEIDEKPVRTVHVRPFLLGRTEVTQAQWRAVMGGNPSHFSSCGDDCPVENVCWTSAQEYLRKLSAQTGHHYRLPTEAEWEYAARAGSSTRYWWGQTASREHANYGSDKCCEGLASGRDRWTATAPVAQFPANPFGLHDMHGNVKEWVQDSYLPNYAAAPVDGSARTSGGDAALRVMRGGAWESTPADLRSTSRDLGTPGFRCNATGLRVARNP